MAMRKSFFYVLLIALLAYCAACSKANEQTSSSPTPAPSPVSIGFACARRTDSSA